MVHAEPARVVPGLSPAQTGDALRRGVAVGPWLAERFLQFVEDVLRRRKVRIAHTEIDDVRARVAGRRLGAVHLLEHVGRQAADAVEVLGHGGVSVWKGRDL